MPTPNIGSGSKCFHIGTTDIKLASSDPEKFAAEYATRKARIDELLKLAADYDEVVSTS